MDCQEIRLNLLAYLDGEVSETDHAAIEAHLASCEECAAELARLRALQADLWDAIPAGLESLRLPDAASERIHARLDQARARLDRARARRERGLLAGLGDLLRPRPALVKVAIPLLTLIVVVVATLVGRRPVPVHAYETIVVLPETLAPDTDAALRVIVREQTTDAPVAGAELQVHLRPRGGDAVQVYSGRTGSEGSAEVRFRVPDNGEDSFTADLVVTTRSSLGEDEIVRPVEIARSFRLYLGSDKPLYQPGQTLHMRVLALDAGQNVPAGERAVQFEVQDPAGRALFGQASRTSAYGIASADYVLNADAPHGEYRCRVSLGDTLSEQTVTVGRYERPPFRVELDLDRPYYMAGEIVEGEVSASRFDGEPVSGAEATVRAYLHNPERALVATLQGRTDARGSYTFRFGLPSNLGAAQANLSVEAEVYDEAGDGSWSGRVVPAAREPLAVDVVAEGGRLRPGIENQVYILVSTPDGAPVQARLDLEAAGRQVSLKTDAYGLATWSLTPDPGVREVRVQITAVDVQGRSVTRAETLSADQGPAQVLLRLDRAAYRVGESMHLELLAAPVGGEVVYVDVTRRDQGQTLGTYLAHLENGRAALAVDLSPQMVGPLELHAYQVLPDGSLARDSRVAVVEAAASVAVDLRADREVYRPGDEGHVTVVTALGGRGVQSALGIAVVDESIYALAERAPGFAKLFFALDQGGYAPGEALPEARDAQDRAARAAWAGLPAGQWAVARSDLAQEIGLAQARRAARLRGLAWGLGFALLVLSVGVWLVVIARLKTLRTRRATVWRVTLSLVGITVVILIPAAVLLTVGLAAMLSAWAGKALLGLLLAAWLADLVVLGLLCTHKRDDWGQIVVLLVAAYGVLCVVLALIAERGGDPGLVMTWAALLSCAGTCVALLAWAVGHWLQRRRVWAVGAVLLVLLSLSLVVLAGILFRPSSFVARAATDPRVYLGPVGWLSGCAPVTVSVEKEVEKEVEVTVEVEKEVTQVVEVEKEVEVTREVEKKVTQIVADTPEPQATLAPTRVPAEALATPTPAPASPTSTPPATTTPALSTATPEPGEKPAQPEVEPTPSPAPPLPLLGQVAAETIYWLPEAITDAQGRFTVDLSFPDVPATWRMTVLASTLNGELGEASATLVVK